MVDDESPTGGQNGETATGPDSRTATDTDSSEQIAGFTSILAIALASLRRRPTAAAPFVLAGILGAASSIARLDSPYPVGIAPFPDDGIVSLSVPIVPPLEPATDIGPAALLGLKPRFVAILAGWQLAITLVTAVAFAVAIWTIAREPDGSDGPNGIVPPWPRIARLVAFALVVQTGLIAAGSVGATLFAAVPGVALLGFLLVVVPIGIALFLAPASIVLDGVGAIAAAKRSVEATAGRPVSIAALVLGLGYLGYVLTGVSHVVPDSPLGVAFGTVCSVAVAGTVHAAVVVAAYRDAGRRSA